VLHIWALHVPGNNNPTGVSVKEVKKDTLPFHPYYTVKDGFAIVLFFVMFAVFVFYFPNILGHADNFIEANPAITLSWIRELPALGESARPMLRRSLSRLASTLVALSANPGFQRDRVKPMAPAVAVILLGGLRELTAQTVEDGEPLAGIIEPAVAAATALVGGA
jgi:hypothetical protein